MRMDGVRWARAAAPARCIQLIMCPHTYQYKYGFSRSILTELMGSSRNHVVNVKPFSYGHFANGGSTIAYVEENKNILI